MKTDRAVYTETKITPPPAGESYTDPIFGTTVKRITDCSQIEDVGFGDGRKCWSCQVEYSSISPFNSDSTRLLLMHGSSGFAVYSGDGKFLFYPTVSGRFEVTASAEPRWSAVDPNIFYYLNGNELKSYNVADRTAAVVHRFDEYIVRDSQGVSGVKALGEEDVSWTGDYFGLVGQLPSGARDIFMYNLKTGAKGPVLNRPKQDFDNVYASPEGHLTVAFDDPGVGPNLGQWLYGSDMQPMRQLTGAAGHQDIGLDENGEECLIWADAANPASAGGQVCNPTGIAKVLLKNAAKTPILTLNWDMAAHVYCPRTPGKALISTYSANPNTAPAPFLDEILIASTDGQRVERLAHHHSTPFTYTHSPRATGNKDLTKVVFNSCMGKADPNYADVYMIDLPASAEPPSGDLSGYSKINFASLEGKELLLKLKVSGGRLTVDMFEKLKT